jgi:hypothetical protein
MTVEESKFVDVDFTKSQFYLPGYSSSYRPRLCAGAFGDKFDIIPESQWRDMAKAAAESGGSNSRLITRIYNQLNEGSCVGNMGGQAMEFMQAKTVGLDRVVPISAMSIYKQIGSSPNSGATVHDCIDRLNDTGCLPLDTPGNKTRFKHTMSHTGFRQAWPSGWKDTARVFSGMEGFVCRSVSEMVTALLRGFCVGVGRAGHSVLYLEVVFDGSSMFIDYVNSWGEWGFGKGLFSYGFGRDSVRLFRESADWCYAFQATNPERWAHVIQGF